MAIQIYKVTMVLVNWAKMDNIMLFKQTNKIDMCQITMILIYT